MWSVPAAILGVSLLLGQVGPKPAIAPADFHRWFDDSCEGRLRIPAAVEERAQRYHYVFLGGFQNESTPGYFAQNIKELRAHGVSRKAIHEIYPSSRETFDEYRNELRDRFLNVVDNGAEKLVVIAHSRGACDALAFALENPEFTRDHVAFLFLVQGPFGGTPLADYVLGEGAPMDRQMPLRNRVLGRISGKMERKLVKRGAHAGLPGMSQGASRRFWDRLLDAQADAIPIVGPKTFYVTSRIEPTELGFPKGSTGKYLDTYYGPNDSVVPLSEQTLPDLGTNLGALELVSHTDLTHKFPATGAPRRYRQALIESILMSVGQAAKEPAR